MTSQERLSKIEAIKSRLNADAEKNGLDRFLTSLKDQANLGVQVIPTRIPSLDIALGIGGIPIGRITEIVGPQQSGKTTVSLQAAAVCQEMGGAILYVDAEHAIDPTYCANLGLDVEDPGFVLCQPDFGEQALDTVLEFLKDKAVDLIIIDSIAMLQPRAKMQAILGESKDSNGLEDGGKFVGAQARMIGNFLAPCTSLVRKSGTALVILNQVRMGIGPRGGYETRLGGNSLAHADSVLIDVRRVETTEDGNKTDETRTGLVGVTRATIKKNKLAPPLRQSLYDIVFGEGADYFGNLIETALVHKCGIDGGKGWYKVDLGNGVKSFRKSALIELMVDGINNGEEEGLILLHTLVDNIAQKTRVAIYDPSRVDRHVGPLPMEDPTVGVEEVTEVEAEAIPELDVA